MASRSAFSTATVRSRKTWALRLERAPYGDLRNKIMKSSTSPPDRVARLHVAHQFAQGLAYPHQHEVIWDDLSTRNAFLFDGWRVKLGDFVDSDKLDCYSTEWYMC